MQLSIETDAFFTLFPVRIVCCYYFNPASKRRVQIRSGLGLNLNLAASLDIKLSKFRSLGIFLTASR